MGEVETYLPITTIRKERFLAVMDFQLKSASTLNCNTLLNVNSHPVEEPFNSQSCPLNLHSNDNNKQLV